MSDTDPRWYAQAEEALSRTAAAVQRQQPVALPPIVSLAAGLVASLKKNDQLVVEALSSPPGPPLLTNLLNVGILAAKVGMGLGYYGSELESLALAGLVHDIGIFAVPQSLVTKSGRLTQEERTLVEQHPELGYEAIRAAGSDFEWLAVVVRQAHERSNGQGYPNKLRGRQICEFAQIIGVVDVFDALVSPRPYRRRLLPHEAVRELLVTERTAFPREVMKALVEQLSVYPLGTSVRLTTGEVGTVVRINARYPLRPTIRVDEQDASSVPSELDLSETPLVSIVETIDPPAVSRVNFTADHRTVQARTKLVTASDQFTSLLESLDAIASAIQDVVETRAASVVPMKVEVGGKPSEHDTAAPRAADADFEKEVVGLFALEAREWLAQIQTALKKLGEGVPASLKSRLYGIILHGITNLAKSASTVQLPAIEEMATNLLPILHEIGREDSRAAADELTSLQEGLERITAAVQRLSGEEHQPAPSRSDRVPVPSLATESVGEPRNLGRSSVPLLAALRDLQRVRSRSVQPARDVLESVIVRAEREAGETGEEVDVPAVERILKELDRLDETFLKEVRERVPALIRQLMALRNDRELGALTPDRLEPLLHQVEALHQAAGRVHATTITMFLHGLRTFLQVAAHRDVTAVLQRLEAVETRLHALMPMAEQWVNIGRIERAAIEEILPA